LVAPAEAAYDSTFGEFLPPYRTVRTAADPEGALLAFLDSTYAAAATLGDWDRDTLEASAADSGIRRLKDRSCP
jgi:hypothetical protein